MSKGDIVEKRKLLVDTGELEGLVELPEYDISEGVENIPGLNKIVPVKNGVTTIPEIPMTFKFKRGSKLLEFFKDWKNKNEYKDCVLVRTDGAGKEIARELWPNTECSKCNAGGYDASAPTMSVLNIILLPEDIIDVDAEV